MQNSEIINKINELDNPYTNDKIDFNFYVRDIQIDGDKVILTYVKLGEDENLNKNFNRSIIRKLKTELNFSSVKLEHPIEKPVPMISESTKKIAIMSGKGGVGKSKVTVNLAEKLTKEGYKVGIMDCDIYGYSIPKIMELYEIPLVDQGEILPIKSENGIEVMSAQYFLEDNQNQAIIWRASMVNKLMNHFFYDVRWDKELDYLLIDLPPGTGDIALNVSQNLNDVHAIVVTTANPDASHVALRSGLMAQSVNFELMGVIENMSYYMHNEEKLYIFGKGGGSEVSSLLDVPIITQIPIENEYEKIETNYSEITKYIKEYL